MPSISRDRELHVMEFAHHDEAAAFVAALSRFLNSPQGMTKTARASIVEVWAESPEPGKTVRLFLSKDALAVAESAFSPVPIERIVNRKSLPAASFLVIEGGNTPSWGAADAASRLARPSALGDSK